MTTDNERRNLNPHAEARLARVIWGLEYSQQNLGVMDWWDALPENRKRLIRIALKEIEGLPRELAVKAA